MTAANAGMSAITRVGGNRLITPSGQRVARSGTCCTDDIAGRADSRREMDKPKVLKMAGVWLGSCDHAGHVGDEFPARSYRDPWCAAQAAAVKRYAQWHYSMGGAEVLDESEYLT